MSISGGGKRFVDEGRPPRRSRSEITDASVRLTSALQRGVEPHLPRSRAVTYALAVGSTLVALGLARAFEPFAASAVYLFFLVAVVGSAFFGGAGPGLLTTVLSVLSAWYYFVDPRHTMYFEHAIDLLPAALFGVSAAFVSAICASFREARTRAESQAAQLEQQASELELQTRDAQFAANELETANARLARMMIDERQARMSQARLAAIVSSSDDAILSMTLDGTITSWNEGATRLLGYTAEEAIGRSVSVLHPIGRRREEAEILSRLMQGEHVAHLEAQRVRKDGTLVDVSISLSPVRDADGRVTSGAKIVRDITERKAAERSARFLSDASQAFTASLDVDRIARTVARFAVPMLGECCVVDICDSPSTAHRAAAVHVNRMKQRLLDELSMRYPPDPTHPTFSRRVLESGNAQLVTDVTPAMLASLAPEDGRRALIQEIGVRSYMSVPLIERGTLIGVMVLATMQRSFTTGDLALAEELGRRAALALDNARLYQAANEASRAKSEFLATMSHELRTPLTAIIGYEELLADGITGPVSEAQRHQLRRIKASATHLLGLIDEVLTFSRVDAGREIRRSEEVDARRVVREAADIVQPLAAERSLAFEVELPDEPLIICTDAAKLRQILLNLISNAVKFTEVGGVVVAARLVDEGASVQFEVRDTGIGIASENLGRVFDPFWQVDQNATRRVGGTGLGLSVSRRLAHLLGGEVLVGSELARGSVFRVRIPVEAP